MKRISFKGFLMALVPALFVSCSSKAPEADFCQKNLEMAEQQLTLLVKDAQKENRIPRTETADGHMHWTRNGFDWTEGFFPGTCWYMYEFSGDQKWKDAAEKLQNMYADHRFLPYYHDLGFVFNCSFGNGYRLTKDENFKKIIIEAGNTLISRFDPRVGCIKSWDVNRGWQSKRGWQYPVIIDNMMNLEMLFELSKLTGDDKYAKVAVSHADHTMKNHFRPDYSCYHVVDYDSISGEVRSKQTAQGYAHESSWARGQAWAVYGYTMCYRYTKDERYLQHAQKVADFVLSYPGTPKDMVPYWDYNAPKIPNEPRDASAAAITASALIELSQYSNGKYLKEAKKILASLASPAYQAKLGENNHFVLMHSVGSIPHNNEVDVPLNYSDYYYVEALLRLKAMEHPKKG